MPLITDNKEIANLIEKHFVYIHINHSKGNKNEKAMKRLENLGHFGYPVLVILDEEGLIIHIQNSSYLEGEELQLQKSARVLPKLDMRRH